MLLETTDILAIIIALLGSISVMGLFWRQNIQLQKQVSYLQGLFQDDFPIKIRDCAECADPHDVKDMYPSNGRLICKHCVVDELLLETEEN